MKTDPIIPVICFLGLIILSLIYGEIVLKVIFIIAFTPVVIGFIIAPIIKALEYFRVVKK
tara:strand:- start:2839 stop:3018 length:180 start_codon:yes stop_codon:yes gene_type:complete